MENNKHVSNSIFTNLDENDTARLERISMILKMPVEQLKEMIVDSKK